VLGSTVGVGESALDAALGVAVTDGLLPLQAAKVDVATVMTVANVYRQYERRTT